MAFATDYIASPSNPNRVASFFGTLAQSYKSYRLFAETRAELNALTARDLADLGIHRSEITRIAHEAAYGAK